MSLTRLKTGSQAQRGAFNEIADALEAGMLKKLVFTGRNLAGACTCTGAAVGDKVVGATNLTDSTQGNALFEATITVVNQIQQSSATDLSAKKFDLLLISVP